MHTSKITTGAFFIALFILLAEASTPGLVGAQTQILPVANSTPIVQDAIIWPEIKAHAAYVIDPISNTVLYQKNADVEYPVASLVKIMTAAVTDNIVRMSKPLSEKQIRVGVQKDFNRSDKALRSGSAWLASDLVKYMLIGSSNKAAEALADGMIPRQSFMSLMNFEAKRFGLQKTKFTNPSGLTTTQIVRGKKIEDPGGISTAKEYATMLWKIIEEHPGLLEITQAEGGVFSNSTESFGVQNTNRILNDLPIVVGKTGFSELAGGNLAVVLQKSPQSHAYVVVVLGSTEEARFTDVALLSKTTLLLAEKSKSKIGILNY